MGEQADMMIEGLICQECGEFLGEGMGFPRSCVTCGGGDADEEYNKRVRKRDQVAQATADFPEAARILNAAGATFVRHSEQHYAIRFGGWTLNVYPSNCRLYSDAKAKVRPPFIGLGTPWTLVDVARALVAKLPRAVS